MINANNTTQLILTKEDVRKLKQELEHVFCLVDNSCSSQNYSPTIIKRMFPTVSDLWSKINNY